MSRATDAHKDDEERAITMRTIETTCPSCRKVVSAELTDPPPRGTAPYEPPSDQRDDARNAEGLRQAREAVKAKRGTRAS